MEKKTKKAFVGHCRAVGAALLATPRTDKYSLQQVAEVLDNGKPAESFLHARRKLVHVNKAGSILRFDKGDGETSRLDLNGGDTVHYHNGFWIVSNQWTHIIYA